MPDLSNLYPIQIVDVYSDNRWNASEEKAKGTRGVIFKAGQGGFFSLPKQYVLDAEAVGLPWGVYWIPDSRYSSSYHMGAIKAGFPDMNFGELGWWWDCEKPRVSMTDADYWKTPYAGNGLIETVIDKFTAWCGKPNNIYTAMGFAQLLGWTSPAFKSKTLYAKLDKKLLWSAQYNNFINQPTPFGPWAKGEWAFWQYTPDPDYNYFHGNEDNWQALLDGTYSPPTTEPPPIVIPPIGETVMKGTAKVATNVKPMDGGVTIAQMQIGDYAYGTQGSTDLTDFTHFYRANNIKVELGKPCKATIANLTITNEVETTPPPVDPPPTNTPTPHTVDVIIDGINVYHKDLD